MKKIVTFILLTCMILTFAACSDNGSEPTENAIPEITTQILYDASNVPALLEKHDSVLVVHTANGDAYQEDYYSKEYCYTFYDGEEFDHTFLSTNNGFIYNLEDMYAQAIMITPDGMADMENLFAEELEKNYLLPDIVNDTITSATEKDGQLIVMNVPDQEELDAAKAQGWNIVDGEEYVLDAKTLDLISVKGGSVSDSGEKYEGAMFVTYNAEIPEGMKKLVEYAQQTEDMRTVTVVFHSGAENEKSESIQVSKGLRVEFFADSEQPEEEAPFTMYADAACTQVIEEDLDVNSDVTIYIKWN